MAGRPKMRVVPGPQQWLLIRTDRDGASRRELPQMAAAAMRHFLFKDSPEIGLKHELIATAPGEWRVGPARPLRVLAVGKESFAMSTGPVLADRQQLPTTAVVSATQPWFVLVKFWWRAPEKTIEYPALKEGFFGRSWQLVGADWLLDRAVRLPEETENPSDATWGEAMGDRASAAARSATDSLARVVGGASGLLLVVAALWFLSKRR